MNRPPSHLSGLKSLLLQSMGRGRSAARPDGQRGPARRLAVESGEMRLDPRRVQRFVRATRGDGIPELAGGEVLPPAYGATWETALVLQLLAKAGVGLPTKGLIHLRSELVQIRPLRVDDTVRARLEVEDVADDPRGTHIVLQGRNWNGAGQLCTETSTTLLLRGPRPGTRKRAARVESGSPAGDLREMVTWQLDGGHGRRYARASGDYNPIHLWPLTARPFGYSRPILHGFCIQAMVAHALIERLGGGDTGSLRRLSISFRAPLLLSAHVQLLVGETAEGARRFEVRDHPNGSRLYAEGEAVCG